VAVRERTCSGNGVSRLGHYSSSSTYLARKRAGYSFTAGWTEIVIKKIQCSTRVLNPEPSALVVSALTTQLRSLPITSKILFHHKNTALVPGNQANIHRTAHAIPSGWIIVHVRASQYITQSITRSIKRSTISRSIFQTAPFKSGNLSRKSLGSNPGNDCLPRWVWLSQFHPNSKQKQA